MKSAYLLVSAATLLGAPFALAESEVPLSDAAFRALIAKSFRPGHSLDLVDSSVDCQRELETLSENSDLLAAAEAAGQGCTHSQTSSSSIVVDCGTSSGLGEFQLACTSAGGKLYTIPSIAISCRVSGQNIYVQMDNMPDCIGESCSASVLEDPEAQYAMARLLEQELSGAGYSASCTVANSSPAPSVTLNKLAILGGMVVLISQLVM